MREKTNLQCDRTDLRVSNESPSQRNEGSLPNREVQSFVFHDGVESESGLVELASRSGRRIRVVLDEVGSFHRVPESSVVVD